MAPFCFSKDSPLTRPFRSTWDILSDTTSFINMREDADHYQDMLRDWRRRLQEGSRDPDIQRQVREGIVLLRKAFRKNGYEVSLGSFGIQCEGFRTDISMNEGYRRIVLLIADRVILYKEGQ